MALLALPMLFVALMVQLSFKGTVRFTGQIEWG